MVKLQTFKHVEPTKTSALLGNYLALEITSLPQLLLISPPEMRLPGCVRAWEMEGGKKLKIVSTYRLSGDYLSDGRFLYSYRSLKMTLWLEMTMRMLEVLMILITFPIKYLMLDKEEFHYWSSQAQIDLEILLLEMAFLWVVIHFNSYDGPKWPSNHHSLPYFTKPKLNKQKNNEVYKLRIHDRKLRLGMKNNLRSQNTMPQELYRLVKGIFPTKWRSIKLSMKPVKPTSNDPANHIVIQVDEHPSQREPSSSGASSSGAGDGPGARGAGDGPGGGGVGPGGGGDGPGAGDGPRGGGDGLGGGGPGGGGDGPGAGGPGGGGDGPGGGGAGDGPGDAEPQRRLQEVLLMCFVQVGQLIFTVASKGNGSQSPNEKTLFHIVVGCTFVGFFVGILGIILSYTNPGVVARVTVRIAYLAAAFAFIAAMSMLLPENLMLWISGLAGFTCLAFFVLAIWKGLI